MVRFLKKKFIEVFGFNIFNILIKFIKFGIVGCSGVAVNLSVFTTCFTILELNLNFSAVNAFVVASVTNYLLGHFWAFKSPSSNFILSFRSYTKYLSFSGIGLAINLAVLNSVVYFIGIEFYLLAQLLAVVMAAFVNFTNFSLFVFKDVADKE
tara:strand:- start:24 stop:482 length:459 start_codon:yes stop_codon:yes gene_type:complete